MMIRRQYHQLSFIILSVVWIIIQIAAVSAAGGGFVHVAVPVKPSQRQRHHIGSSPFLTASPSGLSPSQLPLVALSMWSREDELKGSDRIKACIPYMLPLLDGDKFGKYMYERIPPLQWLHDLWLGPLVDVYNGIPFAGIIFFVALTLGTRFATNTMARGVRFSAQQAALIDAALVVPELIGSTFEPPNDVPRYLVEPCMNLVWYTYMTMVVYCIYSNLQGKKPDQIPYISGYAEMVVGPF